MRDLTPNSCVSRVSVTSHIPHVQYEEGGKKLNLYFSATIITQFCFQVISCQVFRYSLTDGFGLSRFSLGEFC